jgi:hypothetical protein
MNTIPLNVNEIQRRNDLAQKLKQGEISLDEAHELRTLLEREKTTIARHGNCLPFFAVTFLIGYVDEYLECKSNRLLASKVEETNPYENRI